MHNRTTIDADVTPRFTACYLRMAKVGNDVECAFNEAHTAHALPRLLSALAQNELAPEQVRYVVVTHAHLDHAAGASALLAACPKATLLAHPRAAKNLIDPEKLIAGAKAVYGEARFAELYGTIDPIPAARVRTLADGESFELGGERLTAWHTYGHAFHHFIVDDPATSTVYGGDTFGLVYPARCKRTIGTICHPVDQPHRLRRPRGAQEHRQSLVAGPANGLPDALRRVARRRRHRRAAAPLHRSRRELGRRSRERRRDRGADRGAAKNRVA